MWLALQLYPAVVVLPFIRIPTMNGMMLVLGGNIAKKILISAPWYASKFVYNSVHVFLVGSGGGSDNNAAKEVSSPPIILISPEPEFPDFELVEFA